MAELASVDQVSEAVIVLDLAKTINILRAI